MATGKPKRRKPSKIKRTDPKQSARFVAAAKELGVEESGKEFERVIAALVKQKQRKEK
ncbi:MAG: hypothetical protein ACREVC_08575 [Burkholderiales bacterium]